MTYQGVTCEKCGAVFPNGSSAELHRMKDHTLPGVKEHFQDLQRAHRIRSGDVLNVRHCWMIEVKPVHFYPNIDDDDWPYLIDIDDEPFDLPIHNQGDE